MDIPSGASKRERRKSPHGTPITADRTPLKLSRDHLPTPTTTAKDDACCLCWDLHEAAATHGGGEAVRRYLVGGGDPESDQWGNSALHVRFAQFIHACSLPESSFKAPLQAPVQQVLVHVFCVLLRTTYYNSALCTVWSNGAWRKTTGGPHEYCRLCAALTS